MFYLLLGAGAAHMDIRASTRSDDVGAVLNMREEVSSMRGGEHSIDADKTGSEKGAEPTIKPFPSQLPRIQGLVATIYDKLFQNTQFKGNEATGSPESLKEMIDTVLDDKVGPLEDEELKLNHLAHQLQNRSRDMKNGITPELSQLQGKLRSIETSANRSLYLMAHKVVGGENCTGDETCSAHQHCDSGICIYDIDSLGTVRQCHHHFSVTEKKDDVDGSISLDKVETVDQPQLAVKELNDKAMEIKRWKECGNWKLTPSNAVKRFEQDLTSGDPPQAYTLKEFYTSACYRDGTTLDKCKPLCEDCFNITVQTL